MARRMVKANIEFISLVPAGANKFRTVFKDATAGKQAELSCISKFDDEKGELLSVVYAPNHVDSQGEFIDREALKEAAYNYIANGAKIDIRHDGKPVSKDKARVAETFLVQKSDPRFHGWMDIDGKAVDLEGAWASVIKIDDPELRAKYRSGEWAGVSMGGTAIVEPETGNVDKLAELLIAKLNPPKPQHETMDPKDILKAITDGMTAGFAGLTAELKKTLEPKPPEAPKPPETPKADPQAPVFKGSYENARDVEKHARAVELYSLRKGADMSSSEGIREYNLAVQTLKSEWAEADAEAGIEETPEQPSRKAGPAGGGNGEKQPTLFVSAEKSHEEQIHAGAAAAKAFMKSRKQAQ